MIIDRDTDINTVIKEDITITNSSIFHSRGIVNGNIYVEEGSTFFLHGMLNGDLIAKPNSLSQLSGTMTGTILQSDGKIELSGMLHTKSLVPENVIKVTGCYINDTKY